MHSNTFSKKFFDILMTTDSFSYDIEDHITNIRNISDEYITQDKDAELFNKLNDTEIKAMLRFVEKPHGRHHIAELEKMLKEYDSASVLRVFLKHFYEHEGHKLVHTDVFKKI